MNKSISNPSLVFATNDTVSTPRPTILQNLIPPNQKCKGILRNLYSQNAITPVSKYSAKQIHEVNSRDLVDNEELQFSTHAIKASLPLQYPCVNSSQKFIGFGKEHSPIVKKAVEEQTSIQEKSKSKPPMSRYNTCQVFNLEPVEVSYCAIKGTKFHGQEITESKAGKKWVWEGSNGKFDNNFLENWHRNIDYSAKKNS